MGYNPESWKIQLKYDSNRLINGFENRDSSESHGFGMEQSPAYVETRKKLTTSMKKKLQTGPYPELILY